MAIALTAIGVAFDAGNGDDALSGVFTAFYVIGCVAAVLAVRQSGVFTAVIQPPLILFVAVPFAYFVFHGSSYTGMKDTLINCGYPLIERFPLMFFTTAGVLLIGMVRWYVGAAARRVTPTDVEPDLVTPEEAIDTATVTPESKPRRTTRSTTARATRATAAASPAVAADDVLEDEAPRPVRKARTTRTTATGAQRSSESAAERELRRSRRSRALEPEAGDAAPSRPRRRSTPPVDAPTDSPRRRTRAGEPRDREPREPREPRDRSERRPSPPLDRRSSADRPERYDRPSRRERPEAAERAERPQRRPRPVDYEPYEPPSTSRSNGSSGTHHPVSRVRYRGDDDGESRVEQRTRPRRSRHAAPDSWE